MSDCNIALHDLVVQDSVGVMHSRNRLNPHRQEAEIDGMEPTPRPSSPTLSIGISTEAAFDKTRQDGHVPLLQRNRPNISGSETVSATLAWWLPELGSAFLSVVLLICTVIVLRVYDGRPATDLQLPKHLTLNGLIAALATLNRAFLTVPVCSSMVQDMWLYFSSEAKKSSCNSSIKDLGLYFDASAGVWGGFVFLASTGGSR